jgi:hypothetical protein
MILPTNFNGLFIFHKKLKFQQSKMEFLKRFFGVSQSDNDWELVIRRKKILLSKQGRGLKSRLMLQRNRSPDRQKLNLNEQEKINGTKRLFGKTSVTFFSNT